MSKKRSNLEDDAAAILAQLATKYDFPVPEIEYRFHPLRRWRFDFAWPELKMALETEGGVWSGGRHTRGKGFIDDCEKYNTAAVMGWLVLRVTSAHLKDGSLEDWLLEAWDTRS